MLVKSATQALRIPIKNKYHALPLSLSNPQLWAHQYQPRSRSYTKLASTSTAPPSQVEAIDEKHWVQPSSWDKASSKYNKAAGFSSSQCTPRLVALAHTLSPLDGPNTRAIDLGAGTGSLTHALARAFPHLPILATDISPQMLAELTHSQPRPSTITTMLLDIMDPITDSTPPGSFSHVFSTMALQPVERPDDAAAGSAYKWLDLLRPNGVLAIATWDFDERNGVQEIWQAAAELVLPDYVAPPDRKPGQWMGRVNLEAGMRRIGCKDVTVEAMRVGIDVGTDGFMEFFWESSNPFVKNRIDEFPGDIEEVKKVMRRVLVERYSDGWDIPFYAAMAVGRKPSSWRGSEGDGDGGRL